MTWAIRAALSKKGLRDESKNPYGAANAFERGLHAP